MKTKRAIAVANELMDAAEVVEKSVSILSKADDLLETLVPEYESEFDDEDDEDEDEGEEEY